MNLIHSIDQGGDDQTVAQSKKYGRMDQYQSSVKEHNNDACSVLEEIPQADQVLKPLSAPTNFVQRRRNFFDGMTLPREFCISSRISSSTTLHTSS